MKDQRAFTRERPESSRVSVLSYFTTARAAHYGRGTTGLRYEQPPVRNLSLSMQREYVQHINDHRLFLVLSRDETHLKARCVVFIFGVSALSLAPNGVFRPLRPRSVRLSSSLRYRLLSRRFVALFETHNSVIGREIKTLTRSWSVYRARTYPLGPHDKRLLSRRSLAKRGRIGRINAHLGHINISRENHGANFNRSRKQRKTSRGFQYLALKYRLF